jgi:hypothetical protein
MIITHGHLDLCTAPTTVKDVSPNPFGVLTGYTMWLAVEETGSHIEYLYQRGELAVANLGDVEHNQQPAISYHST